MSLRPKPKLPNAVTHAGHPAEALARSVRRRRPGRGTRRPARRWRPARRPTDPRRSPTSWSDRVAADGDGDAPIAATTPTATRSAEPATIPTRAAVERPRGRSDPFVEGDPFRGWRARRGARGEDAARVSFGAFVEFGSVIVTSEGSCIAMTLSPRSAFRASVARDSSRVLRIAGSWSVSTRSARRGSGSCGRPRPRSDRLDPLHHRDRAAQVDVAVDDVRDEARERRRVERIVRAGRRGPTR